MPTPTLTLALQNLTPTSVAPGGTVVVTDVTTCVPNSPIASTVTAIDFYLGVTKDQPAGATTLTNKNVSPLAPGQSYTRPDGARGLTIPASVAAGPHWIIARLRQYPAVINSVALTIN